MSDKKDDRKSNPNGFSYGHSGTTRTTQDSAKPKVKVHTDQETESPKR